MTIKVDLLPPETGRWWRLDPTAIVLVLLVMAAALGCGVWGQTLQRQVLARRQSIVAQEQEVQQLKASLPIIEERKKRAAELDREIQLIQNLSKDPLHYAFLLREVAALLPANLYFSTLSVEPSNHSISVAGTVGETSGHLPLATLAELIRSLNNSPSFSDAVLSGVSHESTKGMIAWSFQLQFRYK
jgi:Tfp pilus assembly protein PilN